MLFLLLAYLFTIMIALCYYNQQDLEKSLKYLNQSLELESDFEESLNLKAIIESY